MAKTESILDQIAEAPANHYRILKISDLDGDRLLELSQFMHLSLSKEDMLAVQEIYREWNREPTDVELEVIAQTWSEHCKHRIFGADIEHETNGKKETVKSLFKTYIYDVSNRIFDRKPGFVLSAFHDNAGFIKLDEKLAICLKAETHNTPAQSSLTLVPIPESVVLFAIFSERVRGLNRLPHWTSSVLVRQTQRWTTSKRMTCFIRLGSCEALCGEFVTTETVWVFRR